MSLFPLVILIVGILASLYGIGALIAVIVKKSKNQPDKKLQNDLLISGIVSLVFGLFSIYIGYSQMKTASLQPTANPFFRKRYDDDYAPEDLLNILNSGAASQQKTPSRQAIPNPYYRKRYNDDYAPEGLLNMMN